MKTIGIIGGIAPESTIAYYRLLISLYRQKEPDENYPSIIINSINLKKMLGLAVDNKLDELAQYIAGEVGRLASAGAEIVLLASNTPHLVFNEIQRKSSIPLISIVEAARETAENRGLKKVGLFGTKVTMQGGFYPQVFAKSGIEICLPKDDEQNYINEKYMNELVNAVFLPKTRARLVGIIKRMIKDDAIEGLILGGTELPLILTDSAEAGIPLLDTTQIHVESVISQIL